MKKFFIILFSFLYFSGYTQIINEVTYLKTLTKDFIASNYGAPSKYDVNLYRVNYNTIDVDGLNSTTASGLLCIPDSDVFFWPLSSYSHGTVASRYEVPSYLSGEEAIPAIIASLGFVSVCADYLGLGDSPGVHPYVHADSEASAGIDMLRAAREYCAENEIGLHSTQLFLSGYSQGGHASAALHRLIEQEHSDEFNVIAASHMSGPYNISTAMAEFTLSDEEYFFVSYVANVALSYQRAYGNIFPDNDIHNFFKQPYVDEIIKFRNEEIDLFELNDILISLLQQNVGVSTPKSMIVDEVLDGIINDENHPVNIALRDNDVYEWSPKAITRLVYCQNDDQVSYLNALVAEEAMQNLGAANVLAVNANANANHTQCVSPAVTYTLTLFIFNVLYTGLEDVEAIEASVYPNPAYNNVEIITELPLTGTILLCDMTGRIVRSKDVISQSTINFEWNDAVSGLHILQYIGADGSRFTQKLVVK